MDPQALIESYVDDVVRRLPRRQRSDVGLELRSLLGEELAARAAGVTPDHVVDVAFDQSLRIHVQSPPSSSLSITPPNSRQLVRMSR